MNTKVKQEIYKRSHQAEQWRRKEKKKKKEKKICKLMKHRLHYLCHYFLSVLASALQNFRILPTHPRKPSQSSRSLSDLKNKMVESESSRNLNTTGNLCVCYVENERCKQSIIFSRSKHKCFYFIFKVKTKQNKQKNAYI